MVFLDVVNLLHVLGTTIMYFCACGSLVNPIYVCLSQSHHVLITIIIYEDDAHHAKY